MKENDVRERVQAFLKNTVRLVVVPASMGIGLALIGCGSSDETPQDAGADVVAMAGQSGESGAGGGGGSASGGMGGSSRASSTGGAITLYGIPFFDAGAGGTSGMPSSRPAYMASLPDAGTITGGLYAAPMSSKGGVSSGGIVSTGGSSRVVSYGGLSSVNVTYGASWSSSSGGTGSQGGTGGITNTAPGSTGGIPDGGVSPDARPEAGNFDTRTGGTTTPVGRYGGPFPVSSS